MPNLFITTIQVGRFEDRIPLEETTVRKLLKALNAPELREEIRKAGNVQILSRIGTQGNVLESVYVMRVNSDSDYAVVTQDEIEAAEAEAAVGHMGAEELASALIRETTLMEQAKRSLNRSFASARTRDYVTQRYNAHCTLIGRIKERLIKLEAQDIAQGRLKAFHGKRAAAEKIKAIFPASKCEYSHRDKAYIVYYPATIQAFNPGDFMVLEDAKEAYRRASWVERFGPDAIAYTR